MATTALTRPTPPRWRALVPGKRGLFNLGFLVGVIALWEGATKFFNVQTLIMPSASLVLGEWAAFSNLILTNSLFTLHEALVGFLLAVVVGVALSVVIVYSPLMRQIVMTAIVGINSTPKVALAPVLVIWLGLGAPSKYATAFLLSFFPIVINTSRGLADVPVELMNLYRLMQATPFQVFRKVRLPNALPAMFDGFKIALPLSMVGAIVGEFVAARQGIGLQITIAYSNFNSELVWASIITIAILSLLMFQVLVRLEDRLIHWRPSKQVF